MAVGGTATGSIETSGDQDWFRTSLVAGHHYVITERGSPSGGGTLSDTLMHLYNSGGTSVGLNDDGGIGFNSELGIVATTTGDYYLSAQDFNDTGTGTYTVGLQDLGTSTDRFSAPTLALGNFGSNQGWTSQNTYPRQIADINGDGTSDIVAFGLAGTYVALSTGNGFTAPSLVLNNFGTSQNWSSQDSYPRLLADVNGDGHQTSSVSALPGPMWRLATGRPLGRPISFLPITAPIRAGTARTPTCGNWVT